MAMAMKREALDDLYRRRLAALAKTAPFVMRITRRREMTGPVLIVKERTARAQAPAAPVSGHGAGLENDVVRPLRPRSTAALIERGHVAGEAQRRVLPVLKSMLGRVRDEAGVPLYLERWMTVEGLRHPCTLPLDEEAGAKLALIFRLRERIADLDRIELIARRVERLTREEATYLLSRITRFDPAANRWAIAGLRLMLGGQAKDPAIGKTLDRLSGI